MITSKYLNASHSYFYDTLTWCVQERQPISLWRNLFHLCNDPIVYLLSGIFGIGINAVIYIIQQFEQQKWDWNLITINIVCVVCGFNTNFKPKSNAMRLVLIIFLFAAIICSTLFSSVLIKQITKPILKLQVDSIREIIDGDFNLVGDRFAFMKISQDNKVICYYICLFQNISFY